MKKSIRLFGNKIFAGLLAFCMMVSMIFTAPVTAHAAPLSVPIKVTYGQNEARSMMENINTLRTDPNQAWAYDENNNKQNYTGLRPLQYDYGLERIAMKRAAEIALSYSHTRPNGQKCFTAYDISYRAAGENIAAGSSSIFSSADQVFNAWKEEDENYSGQGHRRNMLSSGFTAVGIGHVKFEGMDYWVQEFSAPGTGESDPGAHNDTAVANIETSDSNIQGMKADRSSISLKKGETLDVSNLKILLSVSNHFGGYVDYFPVEADYEASVSDSSIAEYAGGKLTGQKTGKTTLTLSAFGRTCNVEVQVAESVTEEQPKKTDPTFRFSESTVEKKQTDAAFTNSLVTNTDGKVTFSSGNTSVATVDQAGKVTIRGVGTCTITAAASETANFNAARTSYILVVTKAEDTGNNPSAIEITMQPGDVHGIIGTETTLQAQAKGKGLTYQWRYSYDGKISDKEYYYFNANTDGKLTLRITQKAGQAVYWCHIKDSSGNEVNTNICHINCDIREGYVVSGVCGNQIKWTLDSNGCMTIDGSGVLKSGDISWLDCMEDIKSVIFKGNITEIGDGAFYQATNLRSVTFPQNLTKIGDEAFYETRVSKPVFPSTLKEIGDSAFSKLFVMNSDDSNVILPKGLTKIGINAFYRSELKSLSVPVSVTEIGRDAFTYVRLIYCEKGSYAESYAKTNHCTYEIVENTEQPVTPDKPSQPEKPGESEKPEDTEKPGESEKPEDTEKPDQEEKPGESEKPEQPGTGNQGSAQTTQPAEVFRIAVSGKLHLVITGKNGKNNNASVIWKSGNNKYATINADGVVKFKKAGTGKTVTVTAISKADGKVITTAKIKILKNAVTGIKVKNPPKTLKAGKSITLKPVVSTSGKDANKQILWSSSNSKYLTVNSKGKVVAKKAGKGKTVYVYGTAADGSGKSVRIKIRIN